MQERRLQARLETAQTAADQAKTEQAGLKKVASKQAMQLRSVIRAAQSMYASICKPEVGVVGGLGMVLCSLTPAAVEQDCWVSVEEVCMCLRACACKLFRELLRQLVFLVIN